MSGRGPHPHLDAATHPSAGDAAIARHPLRDARRRALRLASIATLAGVLCVWHLRTTGSISWSAWALSLGFVLTCIGFGRVFVTATRGIVPDAYGIACEFLTGFFVANSLLFVLTLVSPLGIAWHVALVGATALVVGSRPRFRAAGGTTSRRAELCSLAIIVFSALAATLWVQDQQPISTTRDGTTVFAVWSDVFIHARAISAFAQAHGLWTISDVKLAGVPAAVYHFASYMMPAALNGLTATDAFDAYAAFQLPFGLLLVGLAGYALVATVFRAPVVAVLASAAVLGLPDSYQQGFGLHYLSFHFMSQVNLGMLYGIACIAIAWLFMIEGCRRGRFGAIVVAYVFLALCVGYKAHLFVANAFLLLLYPCAFFGQVPRRWRLVAATAAIVVFVAAVALSQLSTRVPLLRLDGSGAGGYIKLLTAGFADGTFHRLFTGLYDDRTNARATNAALGAGLILLGTFGWWVLATPLALWLARGRVERPVARRVGVFVVLVVVNYMTMALLLALDDRRVGSPEEFLNRPHAWAYFVVVLFSVAILCAAVRPGRRLGLAAGLGLCASLLVSIQVHAPNLQTLPEWPGRARYADFDAVPTCLVDAARYVRDHAARDDVEVDSRFDRGLRVTAIAERASYVSMDAFGGHVDLVKTRVAAVEAVLAQRDPAALSRWSREARVRWLILHPEDAAGWPAGFLDKAAFRCGDFRVVRLHD